LTVIHLTVQILAIQILTVQMSVQILIAQVTTLETKTVFKNIFNGYSKLCEELILYLFFSAKRIRTTEDFDQFDKN
jgi:hypothetical protein